MTDKRSAIEEAVKAMEQAGVKHEDRFINPWQWREPQTNEKEQTR